MLGVIELHRAAVEDIQPSEEFAYLKEEARRTAGTARAGAGREARLPQRAGHRARAHRHHRLPDGLRHHRHRARHRAGEIQAARRRRHVEDRQPTACPTRSDASVTRRRRSRRSSRTSRSTTPSKTSTDDDGDDHRQRPEARASRRCSTARSRPTAAQRSIHYTAHLKMMAAAQPFLSGAISKTVNMPERRDRRRHHATPTSKAGRWD